MCGFIAQLVEQRTDEALIFFFFLSGFFFPCLNWKIYCDDHSSLLFLLIKID